MTGKTIKVAILAAVLVAMVIGCGQRDNPADPQDVEHGMVFQYQRLFLNEENHTWVNYVPDGRLIRIYTPPGYKFDAQGPKYPILYLLHDFTGDSKYYLFHNINEVADRLIAAGDMKPMFICMPDASAAELGSFYTDGWMMWNPDQADFLYPGRFEQMMWDDLIYFVEEQGWPVNNPFGVIAKRTSRAIGGVGMGGYGALKLALNHPEMYSSVSIANGFVSFEDMIDMLIDNVFPENGVSKGDETGYYTSIDTSYAHPFTNLMYSMSAAFSPHDSLNTDTTTLIRRFQVDLPFDHDGNIVQSVVDRWLAHDLTSLMSEFETMSAFQHLDSIELYIEYSDADQYNCAEQAMSFMERLDALDASYDSDTYSGYTGYPAAHDAFLSERLEEILKFHSDHLSDDPGDE